MGVRHRGCRGLRGGVRKQALRGAPGTARAGKGRRAHRAAVAARRRRQAARRAAGRDRGQPCSPCHPRAVRSTAGQLHLPRRSARQPDDALSRRPRSVEADQGSAAVAEVFEVRLKALSSAAVVLAFIVVVMGAYVRLSDAGLGCPDWPFCYGKPLPAEIADHDALARAWKEMGHRYLAGTLGVVIVLLVIGAWRRRRDAALATAIVLLVALQATLGKWTVTMLLTPAIVTAHLLGGMTTLALLAWLALAQWPHPPAPQLRPPRGTPAAAPAALLLQIVAAR